MLQNLLQGRLHSRDFPCWCSPVPASQCPAVLALVAGRLKTELCVPLGSVPHWAAPLDVVLKLLFWIAGLRLKSALACYLNCVWSCVSWGEQRAGQKIPSPSPRTCCPWLAPVPAVTEEAKAFQMRGGRAQRCKCWAPFPALSSLLSSLWLSFLRTVSTAGSSSLLEVSHPATDRL